MSDSDKKTSGDDPERLEKADRERLQNGTDESILDTEGKPAERYAEQEDSYSRDADTLSERGGTGET